MTGNEFTEERRRFDAPQPKEKGLRYRPKYNRLPDSFERTLDQEAFSEAMQEDYPFYGPG